MGLFRSSPQAKLADRGIDPARLPPGQYPTDKWPVLTAESVPAPADLANWRLRTSGLVEQPLELSFDELRALPATELVADIHCVTRWSRFDVPLKGVAARDLLRLTRPEPSARYVVQHATTGYTTNLPLAALEHRDALLVYEADGAPLEQEHGWPVRLVVPRRYFWKSAKWLTRLEFLAQDEPGFWEGYGYHNEADPFREERYGF